MVHASDHMGAGAHDMSGAALGTALADALARRDRLDVAAPASVAHEIEGAIRRAETDLVRARAERAAACA